MLEIGKAEEDDMEFRKKGKNRQSKSVKKGSEKRRREGCNRRECVKKQG